MEQKPKIRTAAIASVDLCGYCKLMELDEIGTHRALMRCYHEILKPAVAAYAGEIVKSTGDGALMVFASASNAALAMVEFQQQPHSVGESATGNRHFVFRVGIHVAEIIIEADDVYGNGVNIAVRLQEAADPGSICLSANACNELNASIAPYFENNGEKSLKNIAHPISLYRWIGARPDLLSSICKNVQSVDFR